MIDHRSTMPHRSVDASFRSPVAGALARRVGRARGGGARRGRGDRRRRIGLAHRAAASSSSSAGSRASRRCCTACRRSWRAPMSPSSSSCCPRRMRPIRHPGCSSATLIGCWCRTGGRERARERGQRPRGPARAGHHRRGARRGAAARDRRHDRPRDRRGAHGDTAPSPRCRSSTRSRKSMPTAASCARSIARTCGARKRRRRFRATCSSRRTSRRGADSVGATDDAALCERLGLPVVVVRGSERGHEDHRGSRLRARGRAEPAAGMS